MTEKVWNESADSVFKVEGGAEKKEVEPEKVEEAVEPEEKDVVAEAKEDFETKSGYALVISSKKGEYEYKMSIPFGAPLTEAYLAGVKILNEIKGIHDEAVKALEEKKKAEGVVKEESDKDK